MRPSGRCLVHRHGHRFNVTTPGRAVRLSPERTSEDYIDLSLDTDRDIPAVVIRSSRGRGRRAVVSERSVRDDLPIGSLSDEDVIAVMLDELVPFIAR